jgi:lactate permease
MTLVPFFYYALLPGSVGYFIVWYAHTGVLNAGSWIALLIAIAAVYAVFRANRST